MPDRARVAAPDTAIDYDDRGARAVYSVLIELGQVLGAYREKFVVVGGAVPWLLLPGAEPAHVGTLDVDLNLDAEALADGEYASFIELLERARYERGVDGLGAFQLRRWVSIDAGDPIAVIVDLLMPEDAKFKKNRPPIVQALRVISASGGRIALQSAIRHELSGAMPDGRNNTVDLLVASIPAFLVMKGYALRNRDKKKDAYDIYFSVKNFNGGPHRLAIDCETLLADPSAKSAFEFIAEKFRDVEDFGPQTVRAFLTSSNALGELSPEQVQTDAYMQVRAWLRDLGLAT